MRRFRQYSDMQGWLIVFAAWANVLVYFLLWRQTRTLFLESHQPALAVEITNCSYDAERGTFSARIRILNSGPAPARIAHFAIRFGVQGDQSIQIDQIVIQPRRSHVLPMTQRMSQQDYERADTDGNRLWAAVDGTYRSIDDSVRTYDERQEYFRSLNRFVPKWNGDQPSPSRRLSLPRLFRFLAEASG